MRPDLQARPNQEPQEKKKWVEPVAALLMALATQHDVVFLSVSGVDAAERSIDRPPDGTGRPAGTGLNTGTGIRWAKVKGSDHERT